MLTSELNFAAQSTASVVWRHAKQKKGKTGVDVLLKILTGNFLRFDVERGSGGKEVFVADRAFCKAKRALNFRTEDLTLNASPITGLQDKPWDIGTLLFFFFLARRGLTYFLKSDWKIVQGWTTECRLLCVSPSTAKVLQWLKGFTLWEYCSWCYTTWKSLFFLYSIDLCHLSAYYRWSPVNTTLVEYHIFRFYIFHFVCGCMRCGVGSFLRDYGRGREAWWFCKTLNTTIPVSSISNWHFIINGIQYTMFWELWRLISEKTMDFIPRSSVLSYYDGRGMCNTFLSTSETKADPFWDNLLKGPSSVSLSA